MNQEIDYIYYIATSTDLTTGNITVVQAQYFCPFLDFALVAITFFFTVKFVKFMRKILYPKL